MRPPLFRLAAAAAIVACIACAGDDPVGGDPPPGPDPAAEPPTLRVALFNVMELDAAKVSRPDDPQLLAAAAIVARVRPDVLVLQEVDAPPEDPGAVARRFAEAYLAPAGVALPHVFAAPSNTGRLSGHDLNGDGVVATEADRGTRAHGDDSFGYGEYPGQYGMAVLSRQPIAAGEARTFRDFPWRELPGHHVPPGFYAPEELAAMPLSSKSHWDVPVELPGGRRLHLLISHPTPPVFDGEEDRNGRRNFDEIAFWLHYLDGSPALVDDRGLAGGLAPGSLFVLAGDLNADPLRPSSAYEGTTAIRELLAHPLLFDPGDVLVSAGGRLHGRGGQRRPEQVTAEFAGGMRVDYLLPSRRLTVTDGGVVWPSREAEPELHQQTDTASDHHLLWLDLQPPAATEARRGGARTGPPPRPPALRPPARHQRSLS